MNKSNNWIWIGLIIIGAYFLINYQNTEKKEFAFFCKSNEPTTINGYVQNISNFEGFTDKWTILEMNIPYHFFNFGDKSAIGIIEQCTDLSKEGDKISNNYGIDMFFVDTDDSKGEGSPAFVFCSNDKKFTIGITTGIIPKSDGTDLELTGTKDDMIDLKEKYLSNMYDCTINMLPSVSNKTVIFGGIGLLILIFIFIFLKKK